jgi:hypothetical protein
MQVIIGYMHVSPITRLYLTCMSIHHHLACFADLRHELQAATMMARDGELISTAPEELEKSIT